MGVQPDLFCGSNKEISLSKKKSRLFRTEATRNSLIHCANSKQTSTDIKQKFSCDGWNINMQISNMGRLNPYWTSHECDHKAQRQHFDSVWFIQSNTHYIGLQICVSFVWKCDFKQSAETVVSLARFLGLQMKERCLLHYAQGEVLTNSMPIQISSYLSSRFFISWFKNIPKINFLGGKTFFFQGKNHLSTTRWQKLFEL